MVAQYKYSFGNFTFDPTRKLLHLSNNIDETPVLLAEKEAAVLCYLLDRPHQVVSREELISSLWKDTYALGTTVNNVISNLRKSLNCNAKSPKYIKTIQNKGYEFIVDVCPEEFTSAISINNDKDTDSSLKISSQLSVNQFGKTSIFTTTLAILLLVVLVTYFSSTTIEQDNAPQKIAASRLLPITVEQGQEWSPSISSDNQYLAYVHRKTANDAWQLKIKELETAKETVLTQDFANKFSPTWSQSNDKLFFIKTFNRACEIWYADMTSGIDKIKFNHVVNCGVHSNMSPIAVGPLEEWLYFSEISDNRVFILHRVNLITKQHEQLTSPPTNGVGDYALALSPNGRFLAYLRSTIGLKTSLMVMDLTTSEHKVLTQFNHRLYKVSWSNNNTQILYIDAQNNLTSIDTKSKQQSTYAVLQSKALSPYISASNQHFIVDGDFYLNDIVSQRLIPITHEKQANERVEVASSYHDEMPVHNNSQTSLAFVSARSGIKQIWLSFEGKLKQLTQFTENHALSNILFSPNDKSILFLADQVPYRLNLTALTISPLLTPFEHTSSLIWSCDGQDVLLTSLDNGSWNLYRFNIDSQTTQKLMPNINMIKSDCAFNALYITKPKQGIFVYNENENTIEKQVSKYQYLTSYNWLIKNNYLYKVNDVSLTKTDLKSQAVNHYKAPIGLQSLFDIKDARLYYSKKHFTNTSIKQLVTN